jgi:hypothetical protein
MLALPRHLSAAFTNGYIQFNNNAIIITLKFQKETLLWGSHFLSNHSLVDASLSHSVELVMA